MGAVRVRPVGVDEVEWVEQQFNERWPWPRDPGFIRRFIADRPYLVALSADGTYLGHCHIRTPTHPPFLERGIPEIADLNVMPDSRRQGAASAMLDAAENLIAETSELAGIGVGPYRDYGPAQRLYSGRGYVLDGTGAWWNDEPVLGGSVVTADDDLVVYLTKRVGTG